MSTSKPFGRKLESPLYYLGKDSRGRWVVLDQSGRRGGWFVDRTVALRFALFENGNRPQAVVMVPGVLELDLSGKTDLTRPHAILDNAPHERRAA